MADEVQVVEPVAPVAESGPDQGLLAPVENTQDTPPVRRRPQRDPAQVEWNKQEQDARDKKKDPEPSPLLGEGIFDEHEELPDNLPDETKAETEEGAEAATEEKTETAETFNEDLYVRARSAGLGREDIEYLMKKSDGALERIITKLEDRQADERRLQPQTQVKEPEKPEQWNPEAIMKTYGITDANDPLLAELKQGFEARQKNKQYDQDIAELKRRDQVRENQAASLRIDNHFMALSEKYGDLFGGKVAVADLEEDSREAEARNAVFFRAKVEYQRDQQRGRRPKTERQYLDEAADALYGHVINREPPTESVKAKSEVTKDSAGRLHDRNGLFLKKPAGRTSPPEPTTGDDAARKTIRETFQKHGLPTENQADIAAVKDGLL